MLTEPVLGSTFKSKQDMNNICKNKFGDLFSAANHKMAKYIPGMSSTLYFYNTWPNSGTLGGGWGARGYGNITANTRFWIYIDGQRANCWDR